MLANINRLRERMTSQNIDAVIATTTENVYYLTGIDSVALRTFPHTLSCCAVLSGARLTHPYFISTRCEVDQFLDAVPQIADAIGFGPFYREVPAGVKLTQDEDRLRHIAVDGPEPSTAIEALVMVLQNAGLADARLALDEAGVPHGFLDAAREALPRAEFVAGSDLLRWTRKVKTDEEVQRLRTAVGVAEVGIRAAVGIAHPGVTERDMVREFERTVVTADGRPKYTLIKIGRAGVAGQTQAGTEPLVRGDTIWFDVGGTVAGYWFDIARVYSLGEPSLKTQKYYSAILAGEQMALSEARPGMPGRELFDLTVETVRAAGLPHYRRHHVGHGIGVEAYDRVLITPLADDQIEEGTVVNIETPYYEFGLGALQVEDPFVVRSGGNELLTTLSRELVII